MLRNELNALLQSESERVLGSAAERGLGDYVFDGRYHRYKFFDTLARERFVGAAQAALMIVAKNLEHYLEELLERVEANDLNFKGGVGDLSWLIGYGDGLLAEAQIASPPSRYALAQPALMMFQNVDTQPLRLARCDFVHSFESGRDLEMSARKSTVIEPGEKAFIDGFETVVWPESSGVLFLRVATLSLGAYDALFDVRDGRAAGVFSTDVRAAYLQTALRLLGAAQSGKGRALAASAERSPIKELRWSALNYYWRSNAPDAGQKIKAFEADAHPQIRRLATKAVAKLAAQTRTER
jgi:hypothetical protein